MTTDILIRVVDLETTGFAPPTAEPIEIGWINLRSTKRGLCGAPTGWDINLPSSALIRHNGPIPPETSAIHHLTIADFGPDANPQDWDIMMSRVCRPAHPPVDYFAAHNAAFERQFLTDGETRGRSWICTWKCALRLWPEAPAHSNQALRYWRWLSVDRGIANQAHRAGPDAYVTAHLLRDMLEQPGVTLAQLVQWSDEPALLARCQIGRWRGTPWRDIDDTSFLRWILDRDFSQEVRFTAQFHLDRLSSTAPTEPVREEA
ncbi:exonuclease domain-containing protein [Bosea sp. MMO-172]|uniref:exonuclease domain-containing protein n=1 Tax=Bosea sp. MMO-172 TaxID=3127885 RepID=UPI00301ACC9D